MSGIAVDEPRGGVGPDDPAAGVRPVPDPEDVAATVGLLTLPAEGAPLADHIIDELHVVPGGHDQEAVRLAIETAPSQHGPQRCVLLTEPPDRLARHTELVSDAQLVVCGDAVEIPDDVVHGIRVGPGDVGIQRHRIEERGRPVVARGLHRFLKRHGLGRAAVVVPVIAVCPNHEDHLLARHGRHDVAGAVGVELLARDWSGRAAGVVLIEQHGNDIVRHGGDSLQLASRGIGRHRGRDDALDRVEGDAEGRRELQRRAAEILGDVLEIDRDTGE